MNELAAAFRLLVSLPFPSVPDDEDLASVIARMSETDAELRRLAAQAGRGETIDRGRVPVVRGLVTRLADIDGLPADDADIYDATVKYLEALVALRDALLAD